MTEERKVDRMYYHHHRNIRYEMDQMATRETAEFAAEWMPTAIQCQNGVDLMGYAAATAQETFVEDPGMVLEFGVAQGNSLHRLSKMFDDRKVYGFDSFQGLPEDWKAGYKKGAFAGERPNWVPSNADLVPGWFEDSLPKWLAENQGYADFVHIDCDLYSSTHWVLDYLANESRLRRGTVILFDEYFNYPGWKQHEHKALIEVLAGRFEYVAFNYLGEQVMVKVK